MAAKLVGAKKITFPAARFIGIRYTEKDRKDGTFAAKWEEWFGAGKFEALEKLGALKESEGSYAAAMRIANGEFEYWIGMLFPEETKVPEGYEYVDMDPSVYALLWVQGKEQTGEIYGDAACELCLREIEKNDWHYQEGGWSFELYNCPRFTTPDQEGNIILDYAIAIEA